ncbi:MAG: tetraacyldisaccharide 4'-kinase, partial [Sphingobacterium sp.]
MWLLRWILFPITILYSLGIWVRNKLYDLRVFSSKSFNVNTIVIGNLAIGGAGKSPITQKCVAYFNNKYKVATLSRGYGRNTQDFKLVEKESTAEQVGDEPLQMKRTFENITVAVDENRAHGIEILQQSHDLILLDDAFQHRKITPKCAVLLFDYNSILQPIWLLPTGNFRDSMNQTKRADII